MHTLQLTFPCSMLVLSNYLPVYGTHIIALDFWPSVKWGHPGSGLIDCTSEGNKLAFDLVERQGQMWYGVWEQGFSYSQPCSLPPGVLESSLGTGG